MRIVEHWLEGPGTERLRCMKNSRRMEVVDTIVLHGTDGANAMSSAHYLARRDTSVSAHLVVGRRGQVIQLLPFDVEAWHAGVSSHEGRTGLNACSVGIEMDNAGRLHRRGDRFFRGLTGSMRRMRCLLSSRRGMPLIIIVLRGNRLTGWRKSVFY